MVQGIYPTIMGCSTHKYTVTNQVFVWVASHDTIPLPTWPSHGTPRSFWRSKLSAKPGGISPSTGFGMRQEKLDRPWRFGFQQPKKDKGSLRFPPSKTRWSPRTRMPTRILRNRDNTYFSHFPANPLVRHPELTRWGDTLVGHPCLTLLRNALVRHSCLTNLFDTLTWHGCKTLLLDSLTWHACLTLLFDTLAWYSYLTLLLDTLTWHSCLTLLTWHSYLTFLLDTPLLRDTLVRQSYLTLLIWHSYLTFL